MLFWILKIIFFSIIFIFLIHNIINFLLETLTVSKTKDMLQIANTHYKNIYDILSNNENLKKNDTIDDNDNDNDVTFIDLLPNNINVDDGMKNELTNYLRQQLNN
jgi:hypothetical protein